MFVFQTKIIWAAQVSMQAILKVDMFNLEDVS